MPNWCSNYLTVVGNSNDIKKFIDDVSSKDDCFDFEKIRPTPPELLEKNTFPPNDGWYSWRLANWGTKWSPDTENDWNVTGELAGLNFETAWGPPCEMIQYLSDKYQNLDFHMQWVEPGMAIVGEQSGIGISEYDWDSEAGLKIREEFGYAEDDSF